VLDAVEEALDKVALAINPTGEREALLAVGSCRNVGPGVLADSGPADDIAVIALVAPGARGTPRGLLGSNGSMIDHSASSVRIAAAPSSSPSQWKP
jgi:hypothetical protein